VQIVVTGAGGFLGRILVGQLLREWDGRFVLVDRETVACEDSRVTQLTGALPDVDLDDALSCADVVFHLGHSALPDIRE